MGARILKFELATKRGYQHIDVPGWSRVLDVAEQDGRICVWVLVLWGDGAWRLTLRVHATGDEVHKDDVYCGTARVGEFVWHVFRVHQQAEPFAHAPDPSRLQVIGG